MICLEIHRHDSLLCRTGLSHANSLAAQVHALTRSATAPASLRISGMCEPQGDGAAHDCWKDLLHLGRGERIRFSLVESDEPFVPALASPAAATVPGSSPAPRADRKTWPNVSMNLSVNGVKLVRAALGLGQEQILCAVHWDPSRPDRLKTLAHSSAEPENDCEQAPQTEWLRLSLMQGDVFEIEVDA